MLARTILNSLATDQREPRRMQTMAPKSLEGCPRELQLSILGLLPFEDLLSLSLVSKFVRSLAEPHLYSSINLSWPSSGVPPLAPLLRSILNRPELGRHVRRLRLDGGRRVQGTVGLDALAMSQIPLASAKDWVRSSGMSSAEEWIADLQNGAVDAVVALLMSLLPRLASLHIGPQFTIGNFRIWELFRCVLHEDKQVGNERSPKFQYLSQVIFYRHFQVPSGQTNNGAPVVLPIFNLPAIRDISVPIENPRSWNFDLKPSPVASLELFRLRETRLGPFLNLLPSLRKLHWHCHYQEKLDSDSSKPFIDLELLVEALGSVKDTLTDLVIEAESTPNHEIGEYEPPDFQPRGSLQGLQNFEHIKTLSVPWAFIMGSSPDSAASRAVDMAEVLPRNLEVLTLSGDLLDHENEEWIDDTVVRAVKAGLGNGNAMASVPNLKRIVLPIPFDYSISDILRIEISKMSVDSGISLESEDDQ